MRKAYILIDGENFVHGLVSALSACNVIKTRDELTAVNLDSLFGDMLGVKTVTQYYSTRIHMPPKSSSLVKKIEKMRLWNGKWIPYIANQNVKIIKAGFLKARYSKPCPNCRKSTEILLEKGVDVRLGVDIVEFSIEKPAIYVVSSDSDLIPAIVSARTNGARVVYVAIEGSVNKAVSKSASVTKIIENTQIIDGFKKANRHG